MPTVRIFQEIDVLLFLEWRRWCWYHLLGFVDEGVGPFDQLRAELVAGDANLAKSSNAVKAFRPAQPHTGEAKGSIVSTTNVTSNSLVPHAGNSSLDSASQLCSSWRELGCREE